MIVDEQSKNHGLRPKGLQTGPKWSLLRLGVQKDRHALSALPTTPPGPPLGILSFVQFLVSASLSSCLLGFGTDRNVIPPSPCSRLTPMSARNATRRREHLDATRRAWTYFVLNLAQGSALLKRQRILMRFLPSAQTRRTPSLPKPIPSSQPGNMCMTRSRRRRGAK